VSLPFGRSAMNVEMSRFGKTPLAPAMPRSRATGLA
jgi:hypothetical protein